MSDAPIDRLADIFKTDVADGQVRIIDVAYTAFTLARQPNPEDGGASDWSNDTRPGIIKIIESLAEEVDYTAREPGEIRISIAFIGEGLDKGGIRVWSDDVPGLILSGADAAQVMAMVPEAIRVLQAYAKDPGLVLKERQLIAGAAG